VVADDDVVDDVDDNDVMLVGTSSYDESLTSTNNQYDRSHGELNTAIFISNTSLKFHFLQ
jgi:hypothetical protein